MAYPISPEDEAAARAYLDNLSAPPDRRLAALDMSYPAERPPLPDERVAGALFDAAGAWRANYGGGTPAQREAMAAQPPEAPAPAPPPAEAPPPEVAPEPPPPLTTGQLIQAGALPGEVERWALSQMRGSPGRVVPEHEQRQGYQVERQAPVDRERVEGAYADAAWGARGVGEAQAGALENEQEAARRRKVAEAANLADFQMQQEAARAELADRESDYQKQIENARVAPDQFWRDRTTGEKILAGIGGLLMGFGGGADKFIQMIRDEREHAQSERDTEIREAGNALADFRSRVMAPAAAAAYEDAIKMRIVAEDIRQVAASSQSVEMSANAESVARQMELEAAKAEEAAKRAEAGAIAEKVAVIPTQTVGGAAGGYAAVAKALKALGASDEQVWDYMAKINIPGASFGLPRGGGKLDEAQEKATGRLVTLPNGDKAYAPRSSSAEKIQAQIDAADQLRKNYARQRALLEKGIIPGSKESTLYNSLAARNELLLKNSKELGAITESDRQMVAPFTGHGGSDLTAFKVRVLAAMAEADRDAADTFSTATRQLYTGPNPATSEPYAPPDPDELMGRPIE